MTCAVLARCGNSRKNSVGLPMQARTGVFWEKEEVTSVPSVEMR